MHSDTSGFQEGERIAGLSVWVLVAIGISEIAIGQLSRSIALTADGVDSMSDAFISFIVWFGLRMSRKSADEKFHYGYYKFESLASLLAAIGMVLIGAAILYEAYLRFLNPAPLSYAAVALATLVAAGGISLSVAVKKRRIASRYHLLSLKTDANNSIKDGSASFIVFIAVLGSTLGLPQLDAIGGMIVAVYIFTVSYVTLREASLVLLDAFHSPELMQEIEKIVRRSEEVRGLRDIKLRRLGPFITGRIQVIVDGSMSVEEMHNVVTEIEDSIRKHFPGFRHLVVTVVPHTAQKGR